MAMENKQLFVFAEGRKVKDSKLMEALFKSLGVSSDGNSNGFNISQGAAGFDFNAKKLTNLADGTDTTHAATKGQMDTALSGKISTSEKGANSGVATLDSGGKIPTSQLPSSVMEFKGAWDASSNTQELANGTGDAGDFYRCSVGGTVNFGAGNITFAAGDYVMYSGSVWQKGHAGGDAVDSVNGQTGAVSLDTDDVSEGSTNLYHTASRAKAAAVADSITNGVTDVAPSQNAVFDALALKADASAIPSTTDALTEGSTNLYFTAGRAKSAAVSDSITDAVTDVAPSQNAVFDALALKADKSDTDGLASFTNKEGDAITARQVVFQGLAGEVSLARADDAIDEHTLIGMVKDASIANDASGNIYLPKRGQLVTGFSGLDVTKPIYVSRTTAGGYVQALTGFVTGEKVVSLGIVKSATSIIFAPEFEWAFE